MRGIQLVALLPEALKGPLHEFLIKLIDDDSNVLLLEGTSCIGVLKELVIEISYLRVSLPILALEALCSCHHCSLDPPDALGRTAESLA